MATLFRSLFGHKKSHSKGAEDDNGNEPPLERDMSSRRSHRSTSSARTARGTARFRDDSMLPPTAAYHTQNTTRVRRGPKSCPGEYIDDDEPMSSRSFNVDHHRRRSNNNQMVPTSSMMTTSSTSHHRERPPYHQRWETSEYGSENTSPIGYQRHQHHHHQHQRRHQEEEDDEEEEEDEQYVQTNRYQEVKRKIRQHYEEKLFNYAQKVKELEKEKSDLVTMLIQLNQKSEKDKKKIEYFKRKWQEAEQHRMQQQQQQSGQGGFGVGVGVGVAPPFGFQTPQFQPMFPFGPSTANTSQRYSFMGAPMHPISSTNTPTTSAMDTTAGGAGESLIPPTDMSFMAHLPLELPQIPVSTANTSGTQQPGSFFNDDEDEDETKNFRDEMEAPRGSMNTVANLEDDEQEFQDAVANRTMLIEGQDSGFSTTPDDVKTTVDGKKA